jgi:hypothetical protein
MLGKRTVAAACRVAVTAQCERAPASSPAGLSYHCLLSTRSRSFSQSGVAVGSVFRTGSTLPHSTVVAPDSCASLSSPAPPPHRMLRCGTGSRPHLLPRRLAGAGAVEESEAPANSSTASARKSDAEVGGPDNAVLLRKNVVVGRNAKLVEMREQKGVRTGPPARFPVDAEPCGGPVRLWARRAAEASCWAWRVP